MIGKLIVHQPTRPQAIACMLRALDELRVKGIATTATFHRQLLAHGDFVEGRVDTGFVGRTWLRLTSSLSSVLRPRRPVPTVLAFAHAGCEPARETSPIW